MTSVYIINIDQIKFNCLINTGKKNYKEREISNFTQHLFNYFFAANAYVICKIRKILPAAFTFMAVYS